MLDWYEDEVRALEGRPRGEGGVAFYGGSSIRLWDSLADDFPGVGAVNLGFGGATLEACAHFFDRLVPPQRPRAVVLYAGDNDLGDGKSPEDVFRSFRTLADSVGRLPGGVPLTFLAVKPSPARWHLIDAVREANRLVVAEINARPSCRYLDVHGPMLGGDGRPRPELFAWDGLHLSAEGYRLWAALVASQAHTAFSRDV